MRAILVDDWWLTEEELDDLYLAHDGTPHEGDTPHSGRWPWGSGDHAYQRAYTWMDQYNKWKAMGLSNPEIADKMGILNKFKKPDVTKLKNLYSIQTNAIRAATRAYAKHLYYDECNENTSEVARRMGKNESTIRSYLNEDRTARTNRIADTAEVLKKYVDDNKYVDISAGTEIYLNVTQSRLKSAVTYLEEQGYKQQTLYIDQLGTNHKTTMNVLTRPDVTYAELSENRYDVRFIGQDRTAVDANGDVLMIGGGKPTAISKDRVYIRYAEDGGKDRDGLIELREGVKDLSLGGANYAQVRINVEDKAYLKGMARYSSDIPEGYDVVFNTNKHEGTPWLADDPYSPTAKQVFKPLKVRDDGEIDWTNPFGAGKLKTIDISGPDVDKEHKEFSACNIVREQDEWEEWSRNLPSQFLSKQPTPLAERQLNLAKADKEREFEEIKALTNPEVKKKFLLDFADECDAAAVELKAAPFPGQQTHVLLPFPELSDNEIYAPKYADGTRVALVRFPHQGKFEIPILTVRNTGSPVQKEMGNEVPDAVGINHNVADRLSGADFDGDTVLVIPLSDKVRVQNMPELPGLKGFDPKERYPYYDGMQIMSERTKQQQMGVVSNLITDMSIQGASMDELARATRHALVVIDAAKHKLDWKASEEIEDIASLKDKYQNGGGASTIISKAKSEQRVDERRDWYPTSKSIGEEGEKIYTETGELSYKATLKGIPLNDGRRVTVREERSGGEKTGRLYFTETDPDTGKSVRRYVERTDFPDDIETLKKDRSVYLNKDPKDGRFYYLNTDRSTGKKVRVYVSEEDTVNGITQAKRQEKSTKMAEATDAFDLVTKNEQGDPKYKIEVIYADYANSMKALANMARKEWLDTKTYSVDKGAREEYKEEVESLTRKVNEMRANAPLERQAQLLGNRHVALARANNPGLEGEALKKLKGRMIVAARDVISNQKYEKLKLTDREVEAIQHNAISASTLRDLLNRADSDNIKEKFTPRVTKTVTPAMEALARSMFSSGYSYADVAERLGVSPTTVNKILKGKEE